MSYSTVVPARTQSQRPRKINKMSASERYISIFYKNFRIQLLRWMNRQLPNLLLSKSI